MSVAADIMDAVCEELEEAEQGIFCQLDGCPEEPHDIVAIDVESRLLLGVCPQHGRFAVDVSKHYDARLADAVETERYHEGLYDLQRDKDLR